MSYSIVIEKKAKKFIDNQPKVQQIRILKAIEKLPSTGDIKPLVKYDEVYRLRVGDFRIIFTKHDDIFRINIIDAGARGDIYKK